MDNTEKLIKKLQQLGETETKFDELRANLQTAKNELITDEQHQAFSDLDAEAAPKLKAAKDKADTLRVEIKELALAVKETTTGDSRMAVYVPPKWKWNNAKLEGYAIINEDVLKCRDQSDPSVQIRVVKPKAE